MMISNDERRANYDNRNRQEQKKSHTLDRFFKPDKLKVEYYQNK